MLIIYRLIIGLAFWLGFPLLLAAVLATGRHRRGLKERLGFYDLAQETAAAPCTVWIHAASIGEVKAAATLIEEVRRVAPAIRIVATTMTIHGRDFARQHLGPAVSCHLAPLDVPLIVGRAVNRIDPDIYLCLETELWPLLLAALADRGAAALLLNARISDRSIARYRRLHRFFGPVLRRYGAIAAISDGDRRRLVEIGARPDTVTVTGNIKYDCTLPDDPEGTAGIWRTLLAVDSSTDVFVAGSTHEPEEELLLPLYDDLHRRRGQLWLIAPRHQDRVAGVAALLEARGLPYQLLSALKSGERRSEPLVIVDTVGDLADLYSVATFAFIGGSLADCGGHNVMEPAVWGRVVFFGPHVQDFAAAAALLVERGGGFMVDSVDEMKTRIETLCTDREQLAAGQRRAGEAAREGRGARARQAALIESFVLRRCTGAGEGTNES